MNPTRHRFIIFAFFGLFYIFFTFLSPVYQGPDEQIHYATIQHRAEPEKKAWTISTPESNISGKDIATFNFSEEVIQLGKQTQFDEVKWQNENTAQFEIGSQYGKNEMLFSELPYKRYVDSYPPNVSYNTSWYYWAGSLIEKNLGAFSIIERFFTLRLFSVLILLTTLTIVFFTASKIFTSRWQAFLFSILVGFQPMLISTGSIVNIDIALIFGTTLFFLGGISVLKNPKSTLAHALLLTGLIIAATAKGPGIAFLFVSLILYFFLFKEKIYSLSSPIAAILSAMIIALIVAFPYFPESFVQSYFYLDSPSQFSSPLASLAEYLKKSLDFGTFERTHESYWGSFGWLDTRIGDLPLRLLFLVEILGWIGTACFFFSKKSPDYLPQKSILFFSLGMLLALQLAIRFYDWRVFDGAGKILIGTPGRYFLPTLVPHLVILITGLGFLFTKNRSHFTLLLKVLAVGMILLSLYALFPIIIPRYYL